MRTRLAQEVRSAFKRVEFGPDRITATYKGLVPYGRIMQPRDVTVLVFTENPDEIAEMNAMALDIQERNQRGGFVEEFRRRLQAQRERAERMAGEMAGLEELLDPAPAPVW